MILRLILVFALGLTSAIGATLPEADSRLVNLRLVVTDDNGNPVKGLTGTDFQVVDDGKKQNVKLVRYGNTPAQPESPGLNEFSNRGRGEIPHAAVVLLDLLNEPFEIQSQISNRLIRSLEKIDTADYLYLYILGFDGKLFIVHGLPQTADVSQRSSAEWTRRIKPLMDEAMRNVMGIRPTASVADVRVQLTLQALATLASELSRAPGRKNLVWITNGVPISLGHGAILVDFRPVMRRISEVLDQSGIAVYPIRQSISPLDIGDEDTLNHFAAMTGGRPDRGHDIRTVIVQAMKDVADDYLLGYYPTPQKWDKKFHKVEVTSTRKGVHIQTISGYYAWAEPEATQAQQAFDMASSASFDSAGIGLRARLLEDTQRANQVHIDLHINAHDIAFIPDQNEYIAQMQISLIQDLPVGGVQRGPVEPLMLHYTAEQYEEALEKGIDFAQDVALRENADRVRFIVFDQDSDAVGSITIPINAVMTQNKTKTE
jgi:VWFA-related protein